MVLLLYVLQTRCLWFSSTTDTHRLSLDMKYRNAEQIYLSLIHLSETCFCSWFIFDIDIHHRKPNKQIRNAGLARHAASCAGISSSTTKNQSAPKRPSLNQTTQDGPNQKRVRLTPDENDECVIIEDSPPSQTTTNQQLSSSEKSLNALDVVNFFRMKPHNIGYAFVLVS